MITKDGRYTIEKIIGKGSFGTVAKAFDKQMNRNVAIKKVVNFEKNEYSCLQMLREIKLMKELLK